MQTIKWNAVQWNMRFDDVCIYRVNCAVHSKYAIQKLRFK